MIPQDQQGGIPPPMPPSGGYGGRSYFNNYDNVEGLKYRLGAEDSIKDTTEMLKGAVKDRNGRTVSYDERLKMMNDVGIFRVEFIMRGCVGKLTHLTNYSHEDRINTIMKPTARMVAREMARNRRTWEIKERDVIQIVVEKNMIESMQRGKEGFDNNNVSRNWMVSENIDNMPPPQSKLNPISWFGGGNRGNY